MGGESSDGDAPPRLLSDEQESTIVGWLAKDMHTSEIARKELIHWYAEQLLRGEAAVPPGFADGFLERHASSVRALEQQQPAQPRRLNALERRAKQDRLRRLYGDAAAVPPVREPAPYPEGDVIHSLGSVTVVRHVDGAGAAVVTKYTTREDGFGGAGDHPNEAAALRHVRAHTTIPVPAVVSSAWDRITTEYVPGQTLKQAWPALTPEQRAGVLDQLRGYIAQLQALRPPDAGQRIGRLGGQGALLPSFMPRVGGPFATVMEFHDWLVRKAEGPPSSSSASAASASAASAALREQTVFWHQITAHLGRDYPLVFAHGDLAARNILVRDGRIVALLDWELAGWYPAYWDYVFTLRGLDNVDWATLGAHVPSLFATRYDLEYILVHFILSIN